MQVDVARIAREHGLALVGPNCMGVIDLDAEQRDLHRRRLAVPAARRRGRDRPVGLGHRRVRPLRRRGSGSRGSSAAAPRSSSTCATTSPTASTIPQTSSVILFVEGFKRPERFLALADRALELGKPIMAVKVGRSDQAQAAAIAHSGLARRRGARHRRGARCGRRHPLRATSTSCSRRPSSSRASGGPAGGVGRGRTGVVTVSTGEASLIADLVPRTGVDLPPIPTAARAAILEPRCRRWATSATRSIRGAPPTRRRPTAPPSRRWRPRVRTTSSSSSTTSRTGRCRPRWRRANDVTGASSSRRPRTGRRSCPSTSR